MDHLTQGQHDFQAYLLSEHSAIEQAITSCTNWSATQRLAIYGNAYRARLRKALSSNYPKLHQYLGDELFGQISAQYISQYPSTTPSIRWYGAELALFITDHYDKSHQYLSELAAFEWQMSLVFDAKNASVCTIDQITNVPPEAWGGLSFRAHPSLARINLHWNVVAIWESLVNNEKPDGVIKSVKTQAWILWRRDLLNRFYALSEDEAWAMDALLAGKNFGDICEGLCQWHEASSLGVQAATYLKQWLEAGLIAEVSV